MREKAEGVSVLGALNCDDDELGLLQRRESDWREVNDYGFTVKLVPPRNLVELPMVGGLHHRYTRMAA